MGRITLGALNGDPAVTGAAAADAAPGPPQTPAADHTTPVVTTIPQPPKSVPSEVRRPDPIYSDYERKETRLRQDQLDELAVLARRLNRRRDPQQRRITENTLVRVAVDQLLASQDQLHGATEADLRRSAISR